MKAEVIWSAEARQTYFENLEFLKEQWDVQVVKNFIDRVDEIELLISDNPRLFPPHKRHENIRKCVINKHITLFYSIDIEDRVGLITFWNTHQNPANLKL